MWQEIRLECDLFLESDANLMLASLSKKRSHSNLISCHMRFLLLVIIGVLVYNSNDARFFISDQLNNASEIIRPDAQLNFRY